MTTVMTRSGDYFVPLRKRMDIARKFQADILNRRIVRPVDVETTALGAAYLAGLATGFWKDEAAVENFWRAERCFEPSMPEAKRASLLAGWQEAIGRSLTR